MKLFATVILLCFVAVAAVSAASRIVGGRDAPDGKYPYQVALRIRTTFICGGSILNKRWILTAAHCVVGLSGSSITIVAGTNLLYGGQEQTYRSEYIVSHERYDDFMTPVNDVALIRVNKDIQFNDKVKPISLASEDFIKDNYPVTLTGWGSRRVGGAAPMKLQEITLKVINLHKCARESYHQIFETNICTLTRRNEGACHGDSGGPLVADNMQIGIVSFGEPCAVGKPDVYTRVYSYVNWINHKMSRFQ